MGKDKDVPRKKKTLKGPSSSAQAAELVTKRGGSNAFAKFKAAAISHELSSTGGETLLASFDAISDPTLKTNFKHLNKKDPTTRIKALTHIASNIRDKPQDEIVRVLPEWIMTLKKLVLDNTRQVREQSFIVLKEIAEIVKKDLGPYLKSIMGIWLISMHDHDREVAEAAASAFIAAFPDREKREKALKFCEDEIVDQLIANFQQSVQTLTDSKSITKTEAEERYNRYISSSILALDYLIKHAQVENEKFKQVCSNKQFWKYLTIKNFGQIRASTFKLVATTSTTHPDLLEPNLATLSPLVLGCFNETDPVVHEIMIESLITFMKQFPQAWDHVQPWKEIFPRLWTFLKNPENSSPSKTFQTLLPFVAMLDAGVLGGSNEKAFKFFDTFFSSMWSGYVSERCQAFEKQIIFNTFTEVCMYALLQAKKYITGDDAQKQDEAITIFISATFKNHFQKAVKYFLSAEEIPKQEDACKSVSSALVKFMNRDLLSTSMNSFWETLVLFAKECLESTERCSYFSKRLHMLLQQMKRDGLDISTAENMKSSLSDIFYYCWNYSAQNESNIHLRTAYRMAESVSMRILISSSSISSQVIDSSAFYHKYIVTDFNKYLGASQNVKNLDYINSLYGLIGQFFNVFPEQFSEFDVIIDKLVEKPDLLYTLVHGIYEAQGESDEKLTNAKLDQVIVDYATRLPLLLREDTNSLAYKHITVYLDLIQYLTATTKVSSQESLHAVLASIINALQIYRSLTSEQQSLHEVCIIRILDYLNALLASSVQVDKDTTLKLLHLLFELRVHGSVQIKYISHLFYDTCVQIGAIKSSSEAEEEEEDMSYTTKPDDVRSEFINNQTNAEQANLRDETVLNTIEDAQSDSEEEERENIEAETPTTPYTVNDSESEAVYNASFCASEVSQYASSIFAQVYSIRLTTELARDFVPKALDTLKTMILEPTSLAVSHSQILSQANTLEIIAADIANMETSVVWDSLVFNKNIWQSLRNNCEGGLRQIVIGNDIFLIPFSASDSINSLATSIQLYGRYINFALDKISSINDASKLFSSDLSSLSYLWLVTEVLHAVQSQLVVSEEVALKIQHFISTLLLPSLLSTSGKISYGSELREKFVGVCTHLMSLVQKENNQSYYKDLRSFVMSTLTYLYSDFAAKEEEDVESGSAVGALREIFSEVCSKLLFNQELDKLLDSSVESMNFTQLIESFFSAYLSEKTFDFVVSKLRSGIARQARENQENSLYELTVTWISQCASILMQFTQEIASHTFDKEKGEKLMNLLRVQSSLAVFLNHLKDPEESTVSMHFVVSVTSEFTNALLSSDFANDFVEEVDLIVSRLLFYVYRNTIDGALTLDEQNDEFLVSFVEQHITRCTSLFSAKVYSFEEIAVMIETLYYMVELSTSFVQSRTNNALSVRRVYAQLMNALNTLSEFQLELENNSKLQRLKIFQRVNDRLINDISISIRNIPGDIFTQIDSSYEDLKFSLSLLSILRTSSSIHALITAHDLLTRHQDTSYFVQESVMLEDTLGLIPQEEKYALIPDLVALLKRPHREIRLAPIYEHLRWLKVCEFIVRNEDRNLHYRMLPYFLAWSIVAHLYEQGNDSQKAAIFSTLKDNQSYITLLNSIVSYLITGDSSQEYQLNMYEILSERDLTSTDTSVAIARDTRYLTSMADAVSHESISKLGAQVFFKLMKTFPSLIRTWYLNCVGHERMLKSLDKFLCTKLCPIVIDHEMEEILRNSKTSMPDHVKVKVSKKSGQIIAIYQQDEVNLDVTLSIPPNYPLKPLKIESSKRLGVSEVQWRKWTLKMTSVLFTHEGKLWDSLILWKQNLDRHFDGVEACPICYSIVHTHDHALPKIKCKTCRSKFHGACLFKWFSTSGNTTCPMCRSVFMQ